MVFYILLLLLSELRHLGVFVPGGHGSSQAVELLKEFPYVIVNAVYALQDVQVHGGGVSQMALDDLDVVCDLSEPDDVVLDLSLRALQVVLSDVNACGGIAGRNDLGDVALGQAAVHHGVCTFVVCGVLARTKVKYGDRALRYVYIEAGHAAQNILLQSVALGLGGVPVGAFRDDAVAEVLGLPEGWMPLYIIPTGHPK